MTDGISDLAATGLLTTLGGPIVVGLSLANFFRRKRINWYFLAPFIQAYIVIGIYVALHGQHITGSFFETMAFIWCGSTLASVFVCMVIHWNTSYTIQFPVKLDAENILLRLVGPYLLFGLAALAVSAGSILNKNCGSRCNSFGAVFGYPHYSGSLLMSVLILGALTTGLYVIIFVAVRIKVQDE